MQQKFIYECVRVRFLPMRGFVGDRKERSRLHPTVSANFFSVGQGFAACFCSCWACEVCEHLIECIGLRLRKKTWFSNMYFSVYFLSMPLKFANKIPNMVTSNNSESKRLGKHHKLRISMCKPWIQNTFHCWHPAHEQCKLMSVASAHL